MDTTPTDFSLLWPVVAAVCAIACALASIATYWAGTDNIVPFLSGYTAVVSGVISGVLFFVRYKVQQHELMLGETKSS